MAIRLSGINSGMDTDALVKELVSAYSLKTQKYEKAKTKLEWKQDAWKSLNTKIYNLYKSVSNLQYSSAYNMKKTIVSDNTKATVTATGSAFTGTQSLKINSIAQTATITSKEIIDPDKNGKEITNGTKLVDLLDLDLENDEKKEVSFNVGNTSITLTITKDTKVSDFIAKLKDDGKVNANFDESNNRIFIAAKESGKNESFGLSALNGDENASKLLQALGFADVNPTYGENAKIELNGQTYTSNTNDFSINGLNITVHGTTNEVTSSDGTSDREAISITTSVDTQGIYDKIKDFLTEYNTVINELTKLYNADSAGSYEPLTDEEKEAMTESEIEKWETKIKDSLLRRDSSVSSIMSVMTSVMSQSVVIGGKPVMDGDKVKTDAYGNTVYEDGTKLSLSNFGIQTLGYLNAAKNEQNAYHISGDEDDVNTSGKTNKLMQAIQQDADQVCEFMQSLTKRLYTAVDKKMKSTSLSSAYNVYNDKEMDSQLRNYKKLISEWEEKVSKKEEYYYNKFTAMETALSKIQSQTNALSGMLGM